NDGQYGWHVELIDQADDNTWGTVRIWNSMYAVDSSVIAEKSKLRHAETTKVAASFKNTGSASSFLACIELDTDQLEYVQGSATGSAILLNSCPVDMSQV